MRFAIFGNTYQNKKTCQVERLFNALKEHQAEILVCKEYYEFLTEEMHLSIVPDALISGDDFTADMVISVGGDGTFLKAASKVGNKSIPIIGINTGRLGFMADIAPEEIESSVEDIYSGNFTIEQRSVLKLEASHIQGPLLIHPYALNEIAVLKHDSSSMISISATIDKNYLTTYQADGLIIATPSGSTAYSLSVGGPIMTPQSPTIAITPVAPHSLNVRPIVMCDDVTIQLEIESRSHNFLVAIDGQSQSVPEGTKLKITKADFNIHVVKQNAHTFTETLRTKMMWGADNRDNENI